MSLVFLPVLLAFNAPNVFHKRCNDCNSFSFNWSRSSWCLNMWYESDLDALMTRTCLRPIPMGKVNKKQALIFGLHFHLFQYCIRLFCKYNFSSIITVYNFILCFCLYNLVKEKNTTKYCNWRSCRSITTSNWMDYCN